MAYNTACTDCCERTRKIDEYASYVREIIFRESIGSSPRQRRAAGIKTLFSSRVRYRCRRRRHRLNHASPLLRCRSSACQTSVPAVILHASMTLCDVAWRARYDIPYTVRAVAADKKTIRWRKRQILGNVSLRNFFQVYNCNECVH